METLETIIKKLDNKDRERLLSFAKELYKQKKYRILREEIEERRKEIKRGDFLTHEDVWK
ncbi:hypothetical protein [Persephonella sp.]